MEKLFNLIVDGLTYKDLAGKRHPRVYSVLTILILLFLALLVAFTGQQNKAMMATVKETPALVQLTLEPSAPPEQTQAVTETCPTNPDGWSFADVLPDNNFKRIEPACVYEGLGKSVAWALAVRSGFTRAEAAQALGFTDFPMRRLSEVMALTDTKGPAALAVSFTPPHPDFAEWRVTDDGRLALTYSLRGCFRTYEVIGNQAEPWNKDYPVICVLSEDSAGSEIIFRLDGHTFTSTAEPTRSIALFGYGTDGNWVWLGTQKDPKVALSAIPNFLDDAKVSAGLFGLPVWDAAWMGEKYSLPAKTLPEGWQTMNSKSDRQAILDGLNTFMSQK